MLNPMKNGITKVIDANQSKDGGFIEKHLYNPCLNYIQNEDFSTLRQETVYGPIKMFLLNWGRMGRVLERKENRGWEDKLWRKITKLSDDLERFRTMNLVDTNLEEYKEDIKTCYKEVSEIVKYTSATKTLHLLCPDFFPLWDENIRNKTKDESSKKINHLPNCYFTFM